MRWSKTFIPTMKEEPSEAEIQSHRLSLRAGLIRKLSAGAYTYLPLGLRALHKATQIVREEMDAAAAVEVLMPVIQPVELWEQSGRFADYGPMLMHFKDRAGRRTALGPTHEEVVTDLVRTHFNSYRQFPITLYQIQTKFRDEIRPRFGALRSREFIMKDAYSFDANLDGLNKSYDAMYQAYCRIFDRCGLEYVVVEAESGPIGGDASHEFMIPSDAGEDLLVQCSKCSYAANSEKAEVGAGEQTVNAAAASDVAMKRVDTPGASTIEQVTKLLGVTAEQMIKTLIYLVDGKPLAVLVRGDHEANDLKIKRATGANEVVLADPATIEQVTTAPVGFAGPVGIGCDVIADRAVESIGPAVTGANADQVHLTGVVSGRDFPAPAFADLRVASAGDPCPRCGANMDVRRGIEVGHVFKLGTKYSDALGARFLDQGETLQAVIMGCYGIGVNRIIAAMIETNHDEHGICWTQPLAPYSVEVLALNVSKPEILEHAERIYHELEELGIDVLMDDRDARPGAKFKDADLIGLPIRVAVGDRGLKEGVAEVKRRKEAQPAKVPLEQVAEHVRAMLSEPS